MAGNFSDGNEMIKALVSTNLDTFDATVAEVMDAIDQNLEAVADEIYRDAKMTVNFRDKTGNLRRSISLKKSRYDNGGYVISARGKNKSGGGFHAALVEFGHVMLSPSGHATKKGRVAARPYMRPAKEKGIRLAISLFRSSK